MHTRTPARSSWLTASVVVYAYALPILLLLISV
jgi:hypothetical protein